jgi:hypothetical protein
MSKPDDKTSAAGWNGAFPTTHWTDVFGARSQDEPRRDVALGDLLGRYWKPVYCFLRCKGYDSEAAKDLTQGFFYEIVLGRGLIQQADRGKGRFRTFLLTSLSRYLVSVHRAEVAKQRMPEGGLVRMDGVEGLNIPHPVHCATPLDAFEYAWASALLDQVLADLAEKCRERDNATHWELFRARVLQPIMDNAKPPSLDHLCEKYGISKKAAASNMIFTVKRRFRAVLRRHVRQLVDSDAEVDEEIRHLMSVFSRSGARS